MAEGRGDGTAAILAILVAAGAGVLAWWYFVKRKECPTGQVWDEATQKCIPEGGGAQCPTGQHWDETTQTCVPDNCPAGQHWDGSACVPDNVKVGTAILGFGYACLGTTAPLTVRTLLGANGGHGEQFYAGDNDMWLERQASSSEPTYCVNLTNYLTVAVEYKHLGVANGLEIAPRTTLVPGEVRRECGIQRIADARTGTPGACAVGDTLTVNGQLVGPGGAAIAGANVRIVVTDASGPNTANATTDNTGRFFVSATITQAGSFTLQAIYDGDAGHLAVSSAIIQVN